MHRKMQRFTLQSIGRTNHKFPATQNVQMHLKSTVIMQTSSSTPTHTYTPNEFSISILSGSLEAEVVLVICVMMLTLVLREAPARPRGLESEGASWLVGGGSEEKYGRREDE